MTNTLIITNTTNYKHFIYYTYYCSKSNQLVYFNEQLLLVLLEKRKSIQTILNFISTNIINIILKGSILNLSFNYKFF